MTRITGLAIGVLFLAASAGFATPPGPGQHFDCSNGGDSSCAADDTGCVSATSTRLKCSSGLGKAFAKAIASVIKCHAKQAQMRFKGASEQGAGSSEENCEDNPGNSAKGKLDATIAKLSGICDQDQLDGAATEEAVLFGPSALGLDAQNGNVFCDSASAALIGDDDAGFVPNSPENLKCALTVGKMLSRLVSSAIKCHDKMNKSFFKGCDFDEEICEETDPVSHRGALDKYNQQRDKLVGLGICPSCLDSSSINALGADVLSQVDGANASVYPCAP